MKTVTIEVTQDDINAGVRVQPYACPIALAATRSFGVPVSALYSGLRIGLYERGPRDTRPVTALSRRALRFMSRFDKSESVEPTTLRVWDPR